jgi:O-methyltransferase
MNELPRKLQAELAEQLAHGRRRVAIVGLTAEALRLAADVHDLAGEVVLLGVFDPAAPTDAGEPVKPWVELAGANPDLLVIASDTRKEPLLHAAAALLDPTGQLPHVVLAGIGHQRFEDPMFDALEQPALVPSYATGHPSTRVHLYQCLQFAARHDLTGAVVELGAFKGGTTVWLAKAISALGVKASKVIGFDSWDGFPPRRSLLDLYTHPRCVFRDLDAVRTYTAPYGIELVPGDIAETVPERLRREPILLAFIDTDNYSGTRAALQTIVGNLRPGGAIVLDHLWTTAEYAYTVGERIAARQSLDDAGLLQLHGTGVYVKLA